MMKTDFKLNRVLDRMGYCDHDFKKCSDCGNYYTKRGNRYNHMTCEKIHCPNRCGDGSDKFQTIYIGIPFSALIIENKE